MTPGWTLFSLGTITGYNLDLDLAWKDANVCLDRNQTIARAPQPSQPVIFLSASLTTNGTGPNDT